MQANDARACGAPRAGIAIGYNSIFPHNGKAKESPMASKPDDERTESDAGAIRQDDALNSQLRKDAASWSAARAEDALDPGARLASKPAKRTASASPRASRAKAKAVEAVAEAPVVKKPFKMSYDGTSDRDYIAHRINLGAR